MSDTVDRGITVTKIAAMDQPIDASKETTTAFVGRALRGPLNTPVQIHSFAEYSRRVSRGNILSETWRNVDS